MDTPSTTIGPGFGAFVAFICLALVLWLLMRNMNARMRRMAYREQDRLAQLEREGGAEGTAASSAPETEETAAAAEPAETDTPAQRAEPER